MFRSEKTISFFELLSDLKPHSARELAEVANIDSREVYPRLKRWFAFIDVVKVGPKRNMYKLKREVVDAIRKALSSAMSLRVELLLKKAGRIIERTMGREMTNEERAVLAYLIEYYLSTGKRWVEGKTEPVVSVIARVKRLDPYDVINAIMALYQAGLVVLWPNSVRPAKVAVTSRLV